MTLDALIMLVGALVAILPFLGFPNSWDTFFFFILGVMVIGLGIIVRRRMGHSSHTTQNSMPPVRKTFVENGPVSTTYSTEDHA